MSAFNEPEIVVDPPKDWRDPNRLAYPQGAWPVERFIVTVVADPEAFVFSAERIEEWIRAGLKAGHDQDFADLRVEEQGDGGYVGPLEWPHSYGSMAHEYGHCDCGPILPDDWPDHIQPLVPETALCQDHAQLLPCPQCDADTSFS